VVSRTKTVGKELNIRKPVRIPEPYSPINESHGTLLLVPEVPQGQLGVPPESRQAEVVKSFWNHQSIAFMVA
jgi:hypothetical protein